MGNTEPRPGRNPAGKTPSPVNCESKGLDAFHPSHLLPAFLLSRFYTLYAAFLGRYLRALVQSMSWVDLRVNSGFSTTASLGIFMQGLPCHTSGLSGSLKPREKTLQPRLLLYFSWP